jgi:hypothetical protein
MHPLLHIPLFGGRHWRVGTLYWKQMKMSEGEVPVRIFGGKSIFGLL